jgi:hypothetical protein
VSFDLGYERDGVDGEESDGADGVDGVDVEEVTGTLIGSEEYYFKQQRAE